MTATAEIPADVMRRAARTARLTPRQWEAWQALEDPSVRDVLYGGAKGGGKSFLLCMWAYAMALRAIDRYELRPSDHPLHIGWIGRKTATDFSATTLQTWQREIPASEYRICAATDRHPKHLLIRGSVAIDFGGLDSVESRNKFNSAEYAFVGVDQAEETQRTGDRDDISVLMASRRLTIRGKAADYKGLWTANPRQCWLRDWFITTPKPNVRFVQALPSDNPHLPADYVETLIDAFGHRPELLAAYLDGSWDELEGAAQVILQRWVDAARSRTHYPERLYCTIACDPARFGDDETVIYRMADTQIAEEQIAGQRDTMWIANRLAVMHRAYERDRAGDASRPEALVVVDEIGIGGGIVDRLYELEVPVLAVDAAARAGDCEHYANLRAEMWFEAGRMFSEGEVALHHRDATLAGQLVAPEYSFRNGRILIEDKQAVKSRLNRSPDRADTYVMGLLGLRWQKGQAAARAAEGVVHHRRRRVDATPDPRTYAGRRARRQAAADAGRQKWRRRRPR